jgi:benzoyl-CoA reductase subunit C
MSIPEAKDQKQSVLAAFRDLVRDPHESLLKMKNLQKGKIIACMPMQIPEEIVHAAAVLPVVIPESTDPITIAGKHIQSFFCGYARNVIDVALKGKLDFLDGMIFQDTCHTMRPMFDIINANHPFPFMQRIFLPLALARPQAKPLLLGELKRLKIALENFTGCQITDDALQNSISIYNENRSLMRDLYDLRRINPCLLTAGEISDVNVAGMLMPKEDHSKLLRELIADLKSTDTLKNGMNDKVKLVISGSLCEAPPKEILSMIEEMGGAVVDDDLYTGSRYFLTKAPDFTDPIESLAEAYINMVSPCPTRIYPKLELGPYLVDMVRRGDAKGLVIIMVKFCEAHDYTYPHMRRHLDKAGIPYLMIKTEHESNQTEQIKTRIQAFLEIVRGK